MYRSLNSVKLPVFALLLACSTSLSTVNGAEHTLLSAHCDNEIMAKGGSSAPPWGRFSELWDPIGLWA